MNRRRFIAGVVCPGCGATDTTVLEDAPALLVRICVACDYRETMASGDPAAGRPHGKDGADVVRLINPTGNENSSR